MDRVWLFLRIKLLQLREGRLLASFHFVLSMVYFPGWTGMIMMSPTVTVETVRIILMKTVQIMRRRIISVEIIKRINRVSPRTLT